MIDKQSALVGTNLAIALLDKKIDLTPLAGSLLSEMSRAVMTAVNYKPERMSEIQDVVVMAAAGTTVPNRLNQKTYSPSAHDILMDNYVGDLSKLVASHISFARSVVYKKMCLFTQSVSAYMSNLKVRQAEDFFSVTFFKLHDVFRTQFMEDEMKVQGTRRTSPEIINFGESLNEEFDLLGYLLTGDDEFDELLKSWFATEGKEKLTSYLKNNLPEYSLTLQERLNFYFVNFLFYRNLTIKQDITNGMSVLQLVSKCTVNRDYHLDQLTLTIDNYSSKIRNGDIITPESEVKFSHLSDKVFEITLFADSFEKAAEQGGTIDAVYGYIAKHGKTDLTISTLVSQREEYEKAWNSVRAVYASYLMRNKEFIRIEYKRALIEVLDTDVTEDEKEFEASNKGYRAETMAHANSYIDNLSVAELDNVNAVAFELIAKIAYRYTKASTIIGEMLEIQSVNPEIDMKEAAQAAAANYITDFLLEQCSVNKF